MIQLHLTKNAVYKHCMLAAFVLCIFSSKAQTGLATEPLFMNLENVLELAGADNVHLDYYQQQYDVALAKKKMANEWAFPDIYAGFTTHYLNGAAMNTDGQIFKDIERNNLWAGIGISGEWDFGKSSYQAGVAGYHAESVRYSSQSGRNHFILSVIHHYFDLQTQQLKYTAYLNLVAESDSLIDQIALQVAAGLRYESELLLAKSNYSHFYIAMLDAKQEWLGKSAGLSQLLNLNDFTKIISSDTIMIPIDLLDMDSLKIWEGYMDRPEFKSLEMELNAIHSERKTTTTDMLIPQLRLNAYYSYFGEYSAPLDKTVAVDAGLMWNIPLRRLFSGGEVTNYNNQIELQETRMDRFKYYAQGEAASAIANLTIAEQQMTISEEAVQFSLSALNQSIQRQRIGTAKPYEVFQAQQFFLGAQLDYLHAIRDYNKTQYSLFIAVGNNL